MKCIYKCIHFGVQYLLSLYIKKKNTCCFFLKNTTTKNENISMFSVLTD